MSTVVKLYYDVVSPYSWFAFEVLSRYRKAWDIDLQYKPIFLGGIMQGAGNKPPAMVPAKGKYMFKDLQRLKKYFDIPLNQPSDFASVMFATLTPMRLLTVVNARHPDKVESLSRELWMRIWSRDEDVKGLESMQAALTSPSVGFSDAEAKSLLSQLKADDTKDQLRDATKESLTHGAFGAPTIVLELPTGPEMFFGSDRFEIIAATLGKQWHGAAYNSKHSKL